MQPGAAQLHPRRRGDRRQPPLRAGREPAWTSCALPKMTAAPVAGRGAPASAARSSARVRHAEQRQVDRLGQVGEGREGTPPADLVVRGLTG